MSMMTTTTSAGKPDRFAREYDLIVTRRRKLLGFGGLDQIHLIGLWTDVAGKRRRTELCALGTASSVDTALKLAEAGMTLHPEGTAAHRRYRDWHARLRRTEWCMVRAEARYRALIAELSAGLPVYGDPEAVAVAAE
jgi:hypothetical protein